ncbi:lysine exporter LysO family protein [Infirmifilum lucidum]|uniref:Lysine exporter LysO family protein n=1 Tax=Infirmifilum lucidum TaxID=2776706 RepID=A0A7L9FJZ7_9CREN|nr:lysine exporter LysO family protein [Infirmifilum lucidum]QOJ79206.1 lysine exporter LysO family protein [Infirmifilum lucidum]
MELGLTGILVAFAASIALSKVLKIRVPEPVFKAAVVLLVFTISLWASTNGVAPLIYSMAVSVAMLALLVAVLIPLGLLVDNDSGVDRGGKVEVRADPLLLSAIATGWLAGFLLDGTYSAIISSIVTLEVYAVIIVTGLTVAETVSTDTIRRSGALAFKTVFLSIVSAVIVGLLASWALNLPLGVALAIMLGLGWYSFTGPFVAQAYGPVWGFTAFLTNVLREQIAFVLVPLLKRPKVSMVSIGGATTMDNTLPVYVYTYGEEASVVSLIHGFLLTLLVPLLESIVTSAL